MLTAQSPIPPARVEKSNTTSSSVAKQQESLSQEIIPAVPGEFYGYRSLFTKECPVYALLNCKANKARPTNDVTELGHEANALFKIGGSHTRVLSIKTAVASNLLEIACFGENSDSTKFARIPLTLDEFDMIRSQKDSQKLLTICQKISFHEYQPTVKLAPNVIIAMVTEYGKCGLFLVQDMTAVSIQIAACHILL